MPGPQFVRYFRPVIDALKQLGNSGKPSEVCDIIIAKLKISDKTLNELLPSGYPRFTNQVAWARFYLNKAGYISSSRRGVWSLTDIGIASDLSDEEALRLFNEVHGQFHTQDTGDEEDTEEITAPTETAAAHASDYRAILLEKIRSISPTAFEKLCRRLLLESGFQQVEITGKSGDGGIDGRGRLQVNPLLSFRVVFQCKRYKGNVSAPQIRDFRGGMDARADKGIFLTTGTFTAEARREAARDGAHQIELVDADALVQMFEKLELGLIPRMTYEFDPKFFEEFS